MAVMTSAQECYEKSNRKPCFIARLPVEVFHNYLRYHTFLVKILNRKNIDIIN